MNYLRNTTDRRNKLRIFSLVIFFLGVIIGVMVMLILTGASRSTAKAAETLSVTAAAEPSYFFTEKVQEPEQISTAEPEPSPKITQLGEYTITAYCSCQKCCGEWALKRPIDPATGKQIVKGATGIVLQAGVSVASPLQIGTTIHIDGVGDYIVQDRTSKRVANYYHGKIIDIYFTDHKAAEAFGKQHLNVSIVEGGEQA